MRRSPRINLAGEEVAERHICLLYRGSEGLLAQLGPFIVAGFEDGDREIHFVESRTAQRKVLRGLGVDVAAREASGQLEIRKWTESYTQEPTWSRATMLRYVRQALTAGRGLGYNRTRWIATMEWALEAYISGAELVQYESQLDDLVRSRRDVVLCAFDLERHSAGVIAGVLDAHELALIGGVLRPRRTVAPASARDRILAAAHDHFHNVGIRATGVDTLIQAAGVAKATFYRHFPSKDDLIVAWLNDSRPRWFYRVRDRAEASAHTPNEVIPLIFEGIARWIEEDGFRGCAFQNAAVEISDATHPARAVIREYQDEIEAYLRDSLLKAGFDEADERAVELGVLVAGAIASSVAKHSPAPAISARNAAIRLLAKA